MSGHEVLLTVGFQVCGSSVEKCILCFNKTSSRAPVCLHEEAANPG